jgi:hypothetical protein
LVSYLKSQKKNLKYPLNKMLPRNTDIYSLPMKETILAVRVTSCIQA